MAKTMTLDSLPEIDVLKEENISFDTIVNEMIADYQSRYKELTSEELTLYPADSRRIMLNVTAGKLYQLASIINERHKLNFLQYMYGDFLKNWAANFGYTNTGLEAATTVIRFTLSASQNQNVTVPKGTRVTAGNQIFFATDEDLVIESGSLYADVSATCTEEGTKGNGYTAGQLSVIVDPVSFVASAENTVASSGGHDEYTSEELRELIYKFPQTYSTAGPVGAYEELAKSYGSSIVDVKVQPNTEAVVKIYVLLQNGQVPDTAYRTKLYEYIKSQGKTPDTDKVEICAPDTVSYSLNVKYYLSEDKKEIADSIKASVEDAVYAFRDYTSQAIGRSINPGILIAYTNAAGASRVDAGTLAYQQIPETSVAICSSVTVTFGGYDRG